MPYVVIDPELLDPPCNCFLIVQGRGFRVPRVPKLPKCQSRSKISPARYNVTILLL